MVHGAFLNELALSALFIVSITVSLLTELSRVNLFAESKRLFANGKDE